MSEGESSMIRTQGQDDDKRVVVAMSGGVDSAASALILADQGYQIIGVSMQVWDYRKGCEGSLGSNSKASCCAPADFEDARVVADRRGFPFYVFDFEESFEDSVISPFVDSYLKGSTPNPCLDCNRKVKFRLLRERSKLLGVSTVATGHYAQIKPLADGKLGLFVGADPDKDQSYFLYAMTQDDLRSTLFPVGGMQKSAVRGYLEERGYRIAQKAESQDICFVTGGLANFLRERAGDLDRSGNVVDTSGRVIGSHDGYFRYTVGQRKGLGVSAPNPLYVLEVRPQTSEVVVGEKHELEHEGLVVGDLSWVSGELPREEFDAVVKLRYRHEGVLCSVKPFAPTEGGEEQLALRFKDKWTAVTPGQAAVFYEVPPQSQSAVQRVLGGGIIRSSKDG